MFIMSNGSLDCAPATRALRRHQAQPKLRLGSLCAASESGRAGDASGAGAKSQEPPQSCRTKLAEQTAERTAGRTPLGHENKNTSFCSCARAASLRAGTSPILLLYLLVILASLDRPLHPLPQLPYCPALYCPSLHLPSPDLFVPPLPLGPLAHQPCRSPYPRCALSHVSTTLSPLSPSLFLAAPLPLQSVL